MNNEYLLIVKKIRELIKYNSVMLLHFPKYEKFLLAERIRELAYSLYEGAIIVNKRFHKKTTMTDMNVNHELLRQLVNLAYELKYIDSQKHRVCQAHISEVGKMIGAWVKRLNEQGNT